MTFIIWTIKMKFILAMCLFIIGCSSNYCNEPNEIVLIYGDSSISAVIQQGNLFEGINNSDKETVEFSGTVTKQDTGYLVDIVVIREDKDRKASQNINTTVMLQNELPVVLGGYDNYSTFNHGDIINEKRESMLFSIILKKDAQKSCTLPKLLSL